MYVSMHWHHSGRLGQLMGLARALELCGPAEKKLLVAYVQTGSNG